MGDIESRIGAVRPGLGNSGKSSFLGQQCQDTQEDESCSAVGNLKQEPGQSWE